MPERSVITNLLPRLAELRRNASKARQLALRYNNPSEIENLSNYADRLDQEADAVEVRLAIVRVAIAAEDSGQEIAAIRAPQT